MSNPRKAKGTGGENRGVRFLQRLRFPKAKRVLQQSRYGMPDVSAFGADDLTFVVQVKRWHLPHLWPWHKEALAQRRNSGAEFGALLWIPDRAQEKDWVWVLDGKTMETLLRMASREADEWHHTI